MRNSEHNHEPSENMHPGCRRMTDEEKGRVQELVSAGVPARQGLTLIRREFPESLATAKNCYNAKAQSRLKELAGRSPIQALMDELALSKWVYSVKTSGDGRVRHLFMTHPTSIRLTRRYSKVLLLDCTYKTKRFRMPLLIIIGRTGINSTFYSAFAFLRVKEGRLYLGARAVAKHAGTNSICSSDRS